MKILREIIWDNMRKNKRSSLAIMIALFLMTTLMSCFSGMVYTMWQMQLLWKNGITETGMENCLMKRMAEIWKN